VPACAQPQLYCCGIRQQDRRTPPQKAHQRPETCILEGAPGVESRSSLLAPRRCFRVPQEPQESVTLRDSGSGWGCCQHRRSALGSGHRPRLITHRSMRTDIRLCCEPRCHADKRTSTASAEVCFYPRRSAETSAAMPIFIGSVYDHASRLSRSTNSLRPNSDTP
jgi:hypothetical protein